MLGWANLLTAGWLLELAEDDTELASGSSVKNDSIHIFTMVWAKDIFFESRKASDLDKMSAVTFFRFKHFLLVRLS